MQNNIMKQHLISLLLLSVLVAQSCHKDRQDDLVPAPVQKQLTSVQYQYPGDAPTTETFKYDAQGRVVEYNDGEDVAKVVFSGNQVEVTETRTAENNRVVFHFVGTLDAAGRVTGGNATGNYNLNTVDQRVINLEYDADGYLKKATLTVDNVNTYEDYYTWSNGNLIKVENFSNGVKQYAFLYEYSAVILDRSPYRTYTFLPGLLPNGKKNKNVWTKYTRKREGVADFTGTSAYTKDADGYVATQHMVFSDGVDYTLHYQYQ